MSHKLRKRLATREEEKVAERLGARATPNSGAGLVKGDSRVRGVFRIENKHTSREYYSLTHKEWSKVWLAAMSSGETPIFTVNMKLHRTLSVRVAVVPLNYTKEWDLSTYQVLDRTSKRLGYRIESKHWAQHEVPEAIISTALHPSPAVTGWSHPVLIFEWETFCMLSGVDQ